MLVQQQEPAPATTPLDNSSSPISSSSSISSGSKSSASSTVSSASLSASSSSPQTASSVSSTSSNVSSDDSGAQASSKSQPSIDRLQEGHNDEADALSRTHENADTSERHLDNRQQINPAGTGTDPNPDRNSPAPRNGREHDSTKETTETTTGQDNSSKEPEASAGLPVAISTTPPARAPHQPDPSSAVGNSSQYQPQPQPQPQHTNHHHHHHYKSSGGNHQHPQAHANNKARSNNHTSHHQQHNHSSHNSHNSNNSSPMNSSTTMNSATFSAIRSSNSRGHNNSQRFKNNNHHQDSNHSNHQAHSHNHHNHNHNQQLNGSLSREGQHNLHAPYSTVVAVSSSPADSLSGSDVAPRNTISSSINRRSAAPTSAGPPHYVEMHVYAGECVAFQLMDGQEQIITGPATMTMVSQQENPPVPIPVQVPPGHMIHQVADENGTLRHIIFSVMNCVDSDHVDSNVINFPHESFRVDSLGELVSTSGNSIGLDGDTSGGEQQAASPKSTSASSNELASTNHYNSAANRRGIFNSTSLNAGTGNALSYKHSRDTYKNRNGKQTSGYLNSASNKDKRVELSDELQPSGDNNKPSSIQEQSYELAAAAHDLNASSMISLGGADVSPDLDGNSMLDSSGQLIGPVDSQIYGYPTCACCCCYCDPSAEAVVAAAAAAAASVNGQPPHSSAQMSTGSMIGQHQDLVMMPSMQPSQQPLPFHNETRSSSSGGTRSGRGMTNGLAMGYYNNQANSLVAGSGQSQQAFHSDQQMTHSHPEGATNNMNVGKAHVNKNSRGLHPFKQHSGHKSHHTSGYERHNNYHHYNNQPPYNGVGTNVNAQPHQSDANTSMGYKSSQSSGTQAYQQQTYSNYDNNHSSNYATMANVVSSNASKSPSSTPQQTTTGASYRANQGMYNAATAAATNRSLRSENHQTADSSSYNGKSAPTKRSHHQTNDKSSTVRHATPQRSAVNNQLPNLHGLATNNYSNKADRSASSGSVSPMRPVKGNKNQNQQHTTAGSPRANSSAGSPVRLAHKKESTPANSLKDISSSPISSSSSASLVPKSSVASPQTASSVSSTSSNVSSDDSGAQASSKSQPSIDRLQEGHNDEADALSRTHENADTSERHLDNRQQINPAGTGTDPNPDRNSPAPRNGREHDSTKETTETTTGQDNSSKEPEASAGSPVAISTTPPARAPHQPDPSSAVGNNSQYQPQPQPQPQHTNHHHHHHYKSSGGNHQHPQAHANKARSSNQAPHNSSTAPNSSTSSAIRSSNSRVHNNSQRSRNNQDSNNSNPHHHNQQSNGSLNREGQHNLHAPYTTVVAASSSPANSLSGSDVTPRNTNRRPKQKKNQKEETVKQRQRNQIESISSHQNSTHSNKHHHNHDQPIKIMSILKQCRNKLAVSMGRAVQNSLSSYSDTKFAGLLLVVFTLFATLLAILIDYYIIAPVTE